MQNFKKTISLLVSMVMILSLFVMPQASAATNHLGYSVSVNGEDVTKVFVGEIIDVAINVSDFEPFTAYELAYIYDNQNIKLVDNSGAEVATGFLCDSSTDVDDLAAEYAAGTYGLALKNGFEIWDILLGAASPENGVIRLSQISTDEFDSEGDILGFRFRATEKTNPGEFVLKYATFAENNDLFKSVTGASLRSVPSGRIFAYDGTELTIGVSDIPAIEIYDAPTLNSIEWGTVGESDEYFVKWETPVEGCRGYELTVKKNGEQVEEVVKLGADATSYDVFDKILGSKSGDAIETYEVSLVALGGDTEFGGANSIVQKATKDVAGIPLEKPENVKLTVSVETNEQTGEKTEKKILTWDSVTNADQYVITIKDADNNIVTLPKEGESNITGTEIDLTDELKVGDFTVTVTAKNTNTMYIQASSDAIEHSTGSTVTGTIKYFVPKMEDLIYNDTVAGKVTLIDASNDQNQYPGTIKEDGTFEITKVPNGTYIVEISRVTAVRRVFERNLVLDRSIEKDICASGKKITIFLGNINNNDGMDVVNTTDLSAVIGALYSAEGAEKYDYRMDYVKSTSSKPTISIPELTILIKNFVKDIDTYVDEETYSSEVSF